MVRMGSPVRFRRGAPPQTSSSGRVRPRSVCASRADSCHLGSALGRLQTTSASRLAIPSIHRLPAPTRIGGCDYWTSITRSTLDGSGGPVAETFRFRTVWPMVRRISCCGSVGRSISARSRAFPVVASGLAPERCAQPEVGGERGGERADAEAAGSRSGCLARPASGRPAGGRTPTDRPRTAAARRLASVAP